MPRIVHELGAAGSRKENDPRSVPAKKAKKGFD